MKLPRVNELINHWPKSLALLKESTLIFFIKYNISTDNVWFPDIEIIMPETLITQKNIQIVFFGGFLDRVFESGNWSDKNFTFWCLSTKVKKVLVDQLKFPTDSVGVIPRYKFWDKSSEEKKLNLNSDFQIIYSGRLTAQKNIEMFLAFASSLQDKIKANVEIVLLGEWGNQVTKSRGRFEVESYQQTVESFQEKLHFKKQPKIIGHLGTDEWCSLLKENSLLVNFSTFECEDFGVSVAQAQEFGMPMVLSKWGGHCDVRGNNISWVEVDDIGESFSSNEKILLKSEIVVNKFLSDKLEKAVSEEYTESRDKVEYLTLAQIHSIRLQAMKRYGYGLGLLGMGWMTVYADTEPGKDFFKNFNAIFSGRI